MEQQKLLSTCMALVMNENLDGIFEYLKDKVCNRQVDLNYKLTILKNFAKMCSTPEKSDDTAKFFLEKLHDFDQVDFQSLMGKILSQLA